MTAAERRPFVVGISPDVVAGAVDDPLYRLREDLKGEGIDVVPMPADWPERIEPSVERYHAVVVMRETVTAATLDANPALRHICRWGSGADAIDLGACSARGVAVSATYGSAASVAGAAMTLILSLAYRLPEKQRLIAAGRWTKRRTFPGRGLRGRTVSILGMGRIGTEVARLLAPFGVRLLGVAGRGDQAAAQRLGVELVTFETMMRKADYAVVSCALNPATRHLVDQSALRMLKPSAYIINVSRGEVIDQEALCDALAEGAVAGAGLDVFEEEPLPASHRLVGFDQVILTPHSLGHTEDAMRANHAAAVVQLERAARWQAPGDVINEDALRHYRWNAESPR
ncbi:NAD(P)-dependent oxidoreductase [Jiangella asiatica]|uniref:Dehydrogenase n=1 Tax=Jiangella asiatica TaxID=2530372 RepID=A0A4R5DS87_9ACTN|nr:NAD(P)-dependent oxidoreductase [Jiangella asiatica]TDE14931.1 dehydrogenase [Jiangella asiatica]